MPLYRRVARRGFSNYPFKKYFVPVNLSVLETKFTDGDTVSLETLKARGVVKGSAQRVKILGTGDLSKKLTVEGLPVSAGAREKITQAGGSVTTTESEEDGE
jgi:large subunit ribosomal protein L15